MRKVHAKRAREKHMLEAEESNVRLHFASTSRGHLARYPRNSLPRGF